MANKVTAQKTGATPKILDNVSTISDVKRELGLSGNYTASINGVAAADDSLLNDYNYVTFSEQVKGA